jgi:hypothetical protein
MSEAAAGARVMTRDEVDQALGRLQAEEDEISAALLELEDHPGYRILNGADLTGVTLAQWNDAKAVIGTLWEGLAAHKQARESAAALRSQHARPDQARLAELTRLLTGPSVRLAGPELPLEQRGLLDGRRKVEQLSLAALVARMNGAFAQATEVVAAAETAWSEQVGRLSRAEDTWRAADQLVQSLGLRPERDPAAGTIARIGGELARVRQVVVADPLSGWHDGQVSTEPIDQIQAELAPVAAELDQAAAIRSDFENQARQIGALVGAVEAAEADARAARERVREKIAAAAVPDVPLAAPGLRERLDVVSELRRQGRWTEVATAAAQLQRDAAGEAGRAQAALAAITAPLRERNELRGRLQAYQAKAAATGHGEDLDLAAGYRQAQDLLWTAPCELDQARAAVLRYQTAVSSRSARRVAAGGERPGVSGKESTIDDRL